MNLEALHDKVKEVSAVPIFKGELSTTVAIQLQRNGELKAHISKTPALLICITGKVKYTDEQDLEVQLQPGDFIVISPNIKHWLIAELKSQLLLMK